MVLAELLSVVLEVAVVIKKLPTKSEESLSCLRSLYSAGIEITKQN